VLIAVAGWRVSWQTGSRRVIGLWWTQLILNFVWSPMFFGLQRIDLALGIIVSLLAVIAIFIATVARRDPIAAWLFVPYACWVSFATVLNTALLVLN
jgi:tryptophan-rich sensory protein